MDVLECTKGTFAPATASLDFSRSTASDALATRKVGVGVRKCSWCENMHLGEAVTCYAGGICHFVLSIHHHLLHSPPLLVANIIMRAIIPKKTC